MFDRVKSAIVLLLRVAYACIAAVAFGSFVTCVAALVLCIVVVAILGTEFSGRVAESCVSVVFAAAAFLGLWAGASQFNRKFRGSGAFLLLVAELLFYRYLLRALAPTDTSQKYPLFWPLLLGGVAAVIYLHVRLPAEDAKRSAAESKRNH